MDPIQNNNTNTSPADDSALNNQVNPVPSLPSDDNVAPAAQASSTSVDQMPAESPAKNDADITVSAPISDSNPTAASVVDSASQSPQTDSQNTGNESSTSADANQNMGSF